MSTLREIADQHKQLALLVEAEEFTVDDVKDTFEALEGELSAKASSLIVVVNNFDSDIDAISNEIKRLQARKTVLTNKKDSLRDYLKMNMQAAGITSIKCPLFSITLAKGRDVVWIDSELDIPDDFKQEITTVKVDKVNLLKALKDGPVEGARLVKSDDSLRIK